MNPLINKSSKQGNVFVVAIVIVVVMIVFLGWYVLSSLEIFSKSTKTDTLPSILPEEKANLEKGKKLFAIYESEAGPSVPLDRQPDNYGLRATSTITTPLSGTFVFSGHPFSLENLALRIYTLDLTVATATPKVFLKQYPFTAMAEFTHKDSRDKLFLLTNSPKTTDADALSIHNYNREQNILNSFENAGGSNERHLAWSVDAKLLAYNRLITDADAEYMDLLSLRNWEVAIFNPATDNTEGTIAGAWQPQWVTGGKQLVYLKQDGLYIYTLETKEEQLLVPVTEGGIVQGTSMLGLSLGGHRLIWTTGKEGRVTLYKIDNWDSEVDITEIARMKLDGTEFYWPIFSPDGNYYALQAIDRLTQDGLFRKNARLLVFPVDSNTPIYTYSMKSFDFNSLFTDDWVSN